MAGTKRKADASHSPNLQNVAINDHSNLEVTQGRATRGRNRVAAASASSSSNLVESNDSSASLRASDTKAEEKFLDGASSQTPRGLRAKRLKVSPNSTPLKPSRYSTRLQTRADSPTSKDLPPQLSPRSPVELLTASAVDATSQTFGHENTDNTTIEQASTGSSLNQTEPKSSDPVESTISQESPSHNHSPESLTPNTSSRTRKRKLRDSNIEDTGERNSPAEVSNDLKLEDEEKNDLNPTSFQAELAVSSDEAPDTQDFEIPSRQNNHATETHTSEDIDYDTGSAQNENPSGSGSRGRGYRGRGSGRGRSTRGRARGAALARGSGRGRGRGGGGRGGGKGGGRRNDDSSDVEIERSPSPSPAIQKLLERQKELKHNWKRLAAAQKLMLSVLATRTQQRLVRDKNAHRRAPEFEELQTALEYALHKREKILENECRLRMEEADTLKEAEIKTIHKRFEANAHNIQDEHFYAARGDYMALVEGVQHAEDDEHTEPDVDGGVPESVEVAKAEEQSVASNYETLYLSEPRFQRGYNSRFIREKPGAAAYERGKYGWEDFIQRTKIKEISQEESIVDPIQMLLQASAEAVADEVGPPPSVDKDSLQTLFALADAASNAQPVTIQKPLMPIQLQVQEMPQYAPAPTVIEQQQQQPPPAPAPPLFMLPGPPPSRPVLSTSRGFQDLFTTGRGLPQLPPPPGVTFDFTNRPGPLPGFIPGQHQSPTLQYQPPPPPLPPMPAAAAPTNAAPYYFPGLPHPSNMHRRF